jgi:hypothetical protein
MTLYPKARLKLFTNDEVLEIAFIPPRIAYSMDYSISWNGAKKELKTLASCLSVAIIGASPGLMLYEISPNEQHLLIAGLGALAAEIVYARY